MPQAVLEKTVCDNCGADVRKGTAYCYNCGVPVGETTVDEIETTSENEVSRAEVDPKTKAALDDLAEKLKFDEEEDKKLAKAAAERRKARVSQRKSSKEFTWESADERPGGMLLIATVCFAAFAVIVVLFTVFWR